MSDIPTDSEIAEIANGHFHETRPNEIRERLVTACRALAAERDRLESELADAQQWIDSDPDWKAQYMKLQQEQERLLAHYREGLERIWKLSDLVLEQRPTDVAKLQEVAHSFLIKTPEIHTLRERSLEAQVRELTEERDRLKEDAELAAEDADRLRAELHGVYGAMLTVESFRERAVRAIRAGDTSENGMSLDKVAGAAWFRNKAASLVESLPLEPEVEQLEG